MINTEDKKKIALIDWVKYMSWRHIALCGFAFFLGRLSLFNEYYTIVIAYYGALFYDKNLRRWCGIFTFLSLLSANILIGSPSRYILILVVILGFRLCLSMIKCPFNQRNQMTITGLGMLIINSMTCFLTGGSLYDAMAILLELVVMLGLMQFFSYSIKIIYEKRLSVINEHEKMSLAFLLACILGGIIDFYVYLPLFGQVYFKDVFVFVAIICALYLGGLHSGLVTSVVVSSLLVVIGYMPSQFVAIYVFATLIGGMFVYLKRPGIIFAMGLGLIIGFALFNKRILDWNIIGAYGVGAIVALLIPKGWLWFAAWFKETEHIDEQSHLYHIQKIMAERLRNYTHAFDILYKCFNKMAASSNSPEGKKVNQLIEEAGEHICSKCSMKHFCWQDSLKTTYESCYQMINKIEQKGRLTLGDIPQNFKEICINAESFAFTLGMRYDLQRQDIIWKKKMAETRGLIGNQYSGVAKNLEELCRVVESQLDFNEEAREQLLSSLMDEELLVRDLMILEDENKLKQVHIYVEGKENTSLEDMLLQVTQSSMGIKLEVEESYYDNKEGYYYFRLVSKKKFHIYCGASCIAKEKISGDVYSFGELAGGRYLLALADGMGSGEVAQEESTATIELLESFIEAGFDKQSTLKLINSALILKSDIESFSTVDMALIDEYTGMLELLKLGAAASFIIRGEDIISIKANSLPIGIISKVDLVTTQKQLQIGDTIVMVTDGVLESKSELLRREETFKEFMREGKNRNPQQFAEYLINSTRNLLIGEHDDMTILVARVGKC